jgi:hypothetical protein
MKGSFVCIRQAAAATAAAAAPSFSNFNSTSMTLGQQIIEIMNTINVFN